MMIGGRKKLGSFFESIDVEYRSTAGTSYRITHVMCRVPRHSAVAPVVVTHYLLGTMDKITSLRKQLVARYSMHEQS